MNKGESEFGNVRNHVRRFARGPSPGYLLASG